MEAISLSYFSAVKLWVKFAQEIGEVKLKKAYGSHWPREPFSNEEVYAFYEDGKLIGWGAIRLDPDPIVWFIGGVFPMCQKNGYITAILNWCVDWAFKKYPKTEAVIYSAAKNTKYADWLMANRKERYIGELTYPDNGYVYFAVKKLT